MELILKNLIEDLRKSDPELIQTGEALVEMEFAGNSLYRNKAFLEGFSRCMKITTDNKPITDITVKKSLLLWSLFQNRIEELEKEMKNKAENNLNKNI